ncbi:lytic transglycosylase domain-containing protein [Phaeovulum vinaykumarii]|nr:lytic transglycosylase domain-containing protein [Phaeovulum vinaykumarii]
MTPFPRRLRGSGVPGRAVTLALCLAALLGQALPGMAEIKRVGVPKPGEKRLTIQIDPAEQARALAVHPRVGAGLPPEAGSQAPPPAAVAAAPGPLPFDWYWERVSPTRGAQKGRLSEALAALAMGPGGRAVPAPRLADLQAIAALHGREILAATVGTRVSPALVLAMIGVESSGRVDVVSSAGAVGLMQLIPATAARFGVTDATDPAQNIRGGVAYLDWLMGEFEHEPLMVIAAYNAGENAVKSAGGVPPYAETRGYVPKVLAAWSVARGLCLTPPELMSDGCVFALKG